MLVKQTAEKQRGTSSVVGTGVPGPGRRKGGHNKTSALLKDAVLRAAEASGEDKEGKGGLVGYCTFLAKEEPKAFAQLLGKVLPMQITGEGDGPLKIEVVRFSDG